MKFLAATCALALVPLLAALPVAARDFVQDQAGMFSPSTVAALNQRIGNFNAQTGKEIVVLTVPTINGAAVRDAASTAFSQQGVNGVLVFIARDDRKDIILSDRAGVSAGWFTPDVLRGIRTSMEAQFRSENYDAGITGAVGDILNVYRAHVGSLRPASSNALAVPAASRTPASGGLQISMFWWIIIVVVGFLILRSVLRAFSAPRYYGGPGGVPPSGTPPAGALPGGTPPAGTPPAGGPAYGPGYGGYGGFGGGGSFWSGLLGGLGGAFLGNELFRGGGGGMMGPADAGQGAAPDGGGGWGGGGDAGGGWQSDAGQAGLGGDAGGDWSGGGFGGGGGDFGGGGDSGGGW